MQRKVGERVGKGAPKRVPQWARRRNRGHATRGPSMRSSALAGGVKFKRTKLQAGFRFYSLRIRRKGS